MSTATAATTVPGTTCTVAQTKRALQAENPAIYTKIQGDTASRAGLDRVLGLTAAERDGAWDASIAAGSGKRRFLGAEGWSKAQRHAGEKAIDQAVATCENY
ncbi:MAG: hypothetical protein QM662_13065 [Gordonia sp. (in: high G+C Gram-positive bacteria)]